MKDWLQLIALTAGVAILGIIGIAAVAFLALAVWSPLIAIVYLIVQ